jgi:hypothetical protein
VRPSARFEVPHAITDREVDRYDIDTVYDDGEEDDDEDEGGC